MSSGNGTGNVRTAQHIRMGHLTKKQDQTHIHGTYEVGMGLKTGMVPYTSAYVWTHQCKGDMHKWTDQHHDDALYVISLNL